MHKLLCNAVSVPTINIRKICFAAHRCVASTTPSPTFVKRLKIFHFKRKHCKNIPDTHSRGSTDVSPKCVRIFPKLAHTKQTLTINTCFRTCKANLTSPYITIKRYIYVYKHTTPLRGYWRPQCVPNELGGDTLHVSMLPTSIDSSSDTQPSHKYRYPLIISHRLVRCRTHF